MQALPGAGLRIYVHWLDHGGVKKKGVGGEGGAVMHVMSTPEKVQHPSSESMKSPWKKGFSTSGEFINQGSAL